MVSNKRYIQNVNNAVRKGKFNRPIKIIFTRNKPTTEGKQGVGSHINFKKYDRIAIWKGLAKNNQEKLNRERILSKKLGRNVKIATRDRVLRHELWHVHKPYASERKVRYQLETKTLPNKLPTRRRF